MNNLEYDVVAIATGASKETIQEILTGHAESGWELDKIDPHHDSEGRHFYIFKRSQAASNT